MAADGPTDGIVILGCPRSGTTLLRRILDGHPEVSAPGETYLLTAAARFLEGEPMVGELEVGVLNGLGFLGFDPEEVVSRLREFTFDFRREHAARQGKRKWVEKTAVDSFHLDAIALLCDSHVRYLCVVRHGLDVVCSMQDWVTKAQAYPAELHGYVRETPRPLTAFARAWADATARVADFAAARPGSAVLLRYEDLVRKPEAEMRRILDFLGEDYDPAVLEAPFASREANGFSDWKSFGTSRIESTSVGRWKSSLSSDTVAPLAGTLNPVLERLGYDPIPQAAPRTEAEKRRRYEIGLRLQELK